MTEKDSFTPQAHSALGVKKRAFEAALPYTLPIAFGFLFLGVSYGILMRSKGFSFVYPMLMSMLIFAGSMEFVCADLLLSAFNPWHALILTLMVNARHLFYGISILKKFENTGWKKFYLIFGMCDESFTINSTITPPNDVDRGWFMFFVTLLNQIYWVFGATMGGLLASVLHLQLEGIEFVMTALFVVMFVDQWLSTKNHDPALVGVLCSLVSLFIFGSDSFILPAMGIISIAFYALRAHEEKKIAEESVLSKATIEATQSEKGGK